MKFFSVNESTQEIMTKIASIDISDQGLINTSDQMSLVPFEYKWAWEKYVPSARDLGIHTPPISQNNSNNGSSEKTFCGLKPGFLK